MCTEHRDSEMKTNQYINGVEGIYIILSQVRFMAHGQRSKIPQLMDALGNEVQHIHREFGGGGEVLCLITTPWSSACKDPAQI